MNKRRRVSRGQADMQALRQRVKVTTDDLRITPDATAGEKSASSAQEKR